MRYLSGSTKGISDRECVVARPVFDEPFLGQSTDSTSSGPIIQSTKNWFNTLSPMTVQPAFTTCQQCAKIRALSCNLSCDLEIVAYLLTVTACYGMLILIVRGVSALLSTFLFSVNSIASTKKGGCLGLGNTYMIPLQLFSQSDLNGYEGV